MMLITLAVVRQDNTARIDGFMSVDSKTEWQPDDGYVYAPGVYADDQFYMALENGEWKVKVKPAFAVLAGEYYASVGEEIVFNLKEAGVEIFLDHESIGINEDKTVEFTPESPGSFELEFIKWPFQEVKVTVHAS